MKLTNNKNTNTNDDNQNSDSSPSLLVKSKSDESSSKLQNIKSFVDEHDTNINDLKHSEETK